jgi:RNA polymerase sigma-70 factor, ECF subfamily
MSTMLTKSLGGRRGASPRRKATVRCASSKERRRPVTESILQRVAAGDATAVQECLDRYGGLVWSLARRFCYGNQSDAEDAVQEIFLDLWKSASRFDPGVAAEATFIAMIARRRLIDRRRRLSRTPDMTDVSLVSPAASGGEPESGAETVENAARAAKALASLRPEQQRVLRLSIYQGLSHEKIAEAMGMPLGTVKTHARRGLIKLREMLRDAGNDIIGENDGEVPSGSDDFERGASR